MSEEYQNLQREIDTLRNDFQQLEMLFQSTREKLETEIENLKFSLGQ